MTKLIPFSQTVAEELEANFSTTVFRSTEEFVNFYNSGLVNKGAPEVVELASKVDEAFKNLKLQGKNLVFISSEEVYMDEILQALRPWEVMVKVKRILEEARGAGTVEDNDMVTLESGLVKKVVKDFEGNITEEKLSEEKIWKGADAGLLEEIHENHSTADEPNKFRVSDFLSLEDGFITSIHSELFSE